MPVSRVDLGWRSHESASDDGNSQRTILLVYLCLDVEVDARDDDVGDNVESAHAVQDIWVIERYPLGDLHETPRIISCCDQE